MGIKKYCRLWKKTVALDLSSEMAYKINFFIKMFGIFLMDIISPLLALLIYNSTSGIPGWNLHEFFLFQGTFILVAGISHFFIWAIPYKVIDMVRTGNFSNVLIRPYNPLGYVTSTSVDFDGISEMIVGLFLTLYASSVLKIGLSINVLYYIFIILIAIVFQYSLVVIVSSLSFLVVKSYALLDIWSNFLDLGRYPSTIYSTSLRFFVTFLFPVAVSAFYPASALLRRINPLTILIAIFSVSAFFIFSLVLWNLAMKKHTSAGG